MKKLYIFSAVVGIIFAVLVSYYVGSDIYNLLVPSYPDDLWEYVYMAVVVIIINLFLSYRKYRFSRFIGHALIGFLISIISFNIVGIIIFFVTP